MAVSEEIRPEFVAQDELDKHLAHLMMQEEEGTIKSLIRNIKETINPPKLPPLEVTSKPIPTKELWGATAGNEAKSGVMSVGIHVGVITLLLLIGSNPTVQKVVKESVTLVAPDLAPFKPELPKRAQTMGGGGGGGDRSPTPASFGKAPRPAPRQFTPPTVKPPDNPKLPMEPTIIAQADAPIPQVNAPVWGDPLSKIGVPSNGPGSGGGIGSGKGGGVGSGSGAGFGPGSGGNMGGGAYRIGGGVSAPALIYKVEPEYSEEARKAKWQGVVVLAVVVDEKGQPQNLRVVRSLGLGLDQKAIEAVEKWRFRPGMKDGRPVPVQATIEVNFRLL
jgi:TonB family protein